MNANPPPTTARLLTPTGMGAVAVIRIAGPAALSIVNKLFQPVRKTAGQVAPSNRLHYGQWVAGDETIDDVILSAGSAGDDGIDINCHGGVRIVERVLKSLEEAGARIVSDEPLAEAAHWPADNFIQQEVDQTLPQAKTRRAVDFLLYQRTALVERLIELAHQAWTDAAAARHGLQQLADDAPACRYLVQGATIAIIGPPNAGKSTLANRLFGTPRSIVSPIAGTTRDWVDEPTAIAGIPVNLIDTAGMGLPRDEIDRQSMERSQRQLARADLILLVLDSSEDWPAGFVGRCAAALAGRPILVIANKSDLARKLPEDHGQSHLDQPPLYVSALTGAGFELLARAIAQGLRLADRPDDAPGLFTDRQREAVEALLAKSPMDGRAFSDEILSILGEIGAGRRARSGV